MTTGTSAVQQVRPVELLDVLTADFQRRAEPQFAWKSCVSQFLALPGLRGFWPMSSVGYATADQARDLSGQGNHLTNNNTVTFGYDNLAPIANLESGSTQYLDRADGGATNWADVTGTETYIVSAARGLTFGGWFNPDTFGGSGVLRGLVAKWETGTADRSYLLALNNATPTVYVSTDGTAVTNQAGAACDADNWYFVVGWFDPSTELALYQNGTWYSNTTSIPASINDGTAPFEVGAFDTGTYPFDGMASMVFLCASLVNPAIVVQLYEQSRVMFGVL